MRTTLIPFIAFLLSSTLASPDYTTKSFYAKRDTRIGKEKLYRREDGSVNIDFLKSEVGQVQRKYTASRQQFVANLARGQAAAVMANNVATAALATAQTITAQALSGNVSIVKRDEVWEEAGERLKREKRRKSKRANSIQSITDWVVGITDVEYYVSLLVGSSQQSIPLQIDTGSSDIWMTIKPITGMPTYYDTTKSTTYSNTGSPFTISYVSGNVAGTTALDTMGMSASTRPTGQAFGAITTVSDNFLNTPTDGILGIGFASIARTGRPTYIDNLYSQGLITNKVFGLYLAPGGTTQSTFSVGTYDRSRMAGAPLMTPVISQTYWEVLVTSLCVLNTPQTTSFRAAIDSGTTFVYVPTAIASSFYAGVTGAMLAPEYTQGGTAIYYKYPCNARAAPGFQFAGATNRQAFKMTPTSFSIGTVASPAGYCLCSVIGLDFTDAQSQPMAIVGDSYMKNYYSAFSYSYNFPDGTTQAGVGFAATSR